MKELDVMKVLWDAEGPMITSDIYKENEHLNNNTVQAAVRSLLKKEYIRVADVVYSGTVLSRSYEPAVSKEDYVGFFFSRERSPLSFVAGLVNNISNPEELDEIESMIRAKREELKKGE